MSGRWWFTLGKDGICTVRFECELEVPVLEVREAMSNLAAAAVVDATARKFGSTRHGEPL